jgi:P4 family phage/plasmid primase-like protien
MKKRIRLLEDHATFKRGEEFDASEKDAEAFVNEGIAEYATTKREYEAAKIMARNLMEKTDLSDEEVAAIHPSNSETIKQARLEIKEKKQFNTRKNLLSKLFQNSARAKDFSESQPIFYDKSGIWWLWNHDKKCWELTDEVDILNLIEAAIGIDVTISTNRTEILNALKQEGRKCLPKSAPITWIQFADGIVDLKDPSQIIEPSPEYFITNPIPWNIGSNNQTPIIDNIFVEWVGYARKEMLYEILAYCLLPDYPLHRIFCFIGAGMNGKSSFLELLRKFVGEKNVTCTELDTLLQSRFEVTRLHKKLVCQMGETNFAELSKTSLLKKLSGNDLIGYEYKNKIPFEDKNYAKIVISTNNLPATTDKTIGFYRRWLIIDFPNIFNEKKDILSEIPEEEYENLAKKCIGVLIELMKRREFTLEGTIEERTKKFEDHSNPFEKFWVENIDESDPNSDIPVWEFNKRINEWCKENRFRYLAEETCAKKLKEKGIQQARIRKEWTENGQIIEKQVRCWAGIKWK